LKERNLAFLEVANFASWSFNVPYKEMAIRSREDLVGARAFLIGVILAILIGLFAGDNLTPFVSGILTILGLILGFFVPERNIQTFLFASVSLVIVSFAGIQGIVLNAAISGVNIGELLASTLGALLVLFVPATIVVALKSVFGSAK
jgi:hypothetical protein